MKVNIDRWWFAVLPTGTVTEGELDNYVQIPRLPSKAQLGIALWGCLGLCTVSANSVFVESLWTLQVYLGKTFWFLLFMI